MPKLPPTNRGTGLFGDAASDPRPASAAAYQANIDGGSRGNPGPAAYGVVIRDPRGVVVANLKKYIGRSTNNVAEYYSLIAALDYAQQHSIRALRVESDSELLVRQMRGHYKVKSPELRPLYERAKKMAQSLESFRIEHVYRQRNADADALVNEALDETSGTSSRTAATQKIASPKVDNRGAKTPARHVRARFRNGALYPMDTLDFPEGAEVELLIRPVLRSQD